MTAKSKPWAVVLSCSGSPIRSEHRSKPEAYRKVAAETKAAQAGRTTVSRIRVEQWQPDYQQWALYELINPKEEQ